MTKCAIIGGTGVYSVEGIETEDFSVDTSWGSTRVYRGKGSYNWLHFIPRHGEDHSVPPHRINYRANIDALLELEIDHVVAVFAVGSISDWVKPGQMGMPNQFIDMTWGRKHTFFDGGDEGVHHTSMNEPFCRSLQGTLLKSAEQQGLSLAQGGTYLCANGPRFETPAEIKMYRGWGADVSGMTGATEAILAGERELHYAAVCWSMNWCAGVEKELVVMDRNKMAKQKKQIMKLVLGALEQVSETERSCACKNRKIG